jgi:hypothetical protein
MKIERWFQGHSPHFSGHPWAEQGAGISECLGSVVGWGRLSELAQVDVIIDRLFPGRICDCRWPVNRVVHFNNHPETTREDVDKVLHIYTEEVEAAHEPTR